MRAVFAFVVVLCSVLILGTSLATAGDPRPFAPVQDGYTASAPLKPTWATDHLLIQFTADGLQRASLPTSGDKAAGPVARTGLGSLDAALDEVAATGLRPAFPAAANKAQSGAADAQRWYICELSPGTDVPTAVHRLARDANLADALPDLVAFPAVAPNDPLHASNWGHNNTAQLPAFDWGGTNNHTGPGVGSPGFDANAQAAWNGPQGYGDSGVVIAILDSGVDAGHPDLLQVTGYDFGDGDSNPTDDSDDPGHGTACAGVAAAIANNNLGSSGAAGGCSIMPLKVSNTAGSLLFSAITNAIYYAADNGADVISMSFGAATTSYAPTDNAITYAHNQGVTLLAATGNENDSQISYPAYNPRVIGVGAASPCGDRKRSSSDSGEVSAGIFTDPNGYTCDGERWWGSNYGNPTQDHQGAVDVIAPTILPTTDIQGSGGYAGGDYSNYFNGTSCATPYAAGVCALIKSANPAFTPSQVRAQLVGTAQDVVNVESGAGWDRYSGYGMVDAATAVGEVIPPAVMTAFTADEVSGCAPFTVNFTDLSVGAVQTWSWVFGSESVSSAQNPSYTFNTPGVYDVKLSITTPEGNDTLTKTDYITVTGPPIPSFTTPEMVVTLGDDVVFADTSTGDPTAWAWDFGDGGTADVQNPVHVYTTAGVYAVALTAGNACGSETLAQPNLIIAVPPPPPTAAFSFTPAGGCAPVEITFSDESTGTIEAWAWDFGDGTTATAAGPSHSYGAAGTYDASLVVSNSGGADTMTVAISVDGPPVAAWNPSATLVAVGETVTFSDASTGTPTAWSWAFGDGGTATVPNPDHAYSAAGLYTVTLTVTNGCGEQTLAATDQITVEELAAPQAAITFDPASGCAPLEVAFSDASLNDVTAWQWDFGDGNQASVQNPTHIYATPGVFPVSLVVTGSGGVDTLTVADAVAVEMALSAAFTLSDTLGAAPLAVTFAATPTGTPTKWLWDFGDAATDSVASPTHTYLADGVYDVTLIVSNSCSADTLTLSAAVQINGASAVGNALPARFGLGRSYPNPFNPSTTVVYHLAQPGAVRLDVFDVSGRRVATLATGPKAAGRHEVLWRPRDLASGLYFAHLRSGSLVDTQRLTLLK